MKIDGTVLDHEELAGGQAGIVGEEERRVKIFALNEEGTWKDCGTGYLRLVAEVGSNYIHSPRAALCRYSQREMEPALPTYVSPLISGSFSGKVSSSLSSR